jgi:ABC-type phosphate transport system substrate-binding protein
MRGHGDVNWLDPQTVIAIVTALLALIPPTVAAVYQLRTRRGKSIGHRVQMDTAINQPGITTPTLVLLRIENDGIDSIRLTDYTSLDHGLQIAFTDRVVEDVTVIPGPESDHVLSHLYPPEGQVGMRHQGDTIILPGVPLNPDHHFKLLVWLSGGPVDSKIRVSGGIQDGRIAPTRSRTIDEKTPLFSRFALGTSALLAACLLVLSGIIVFWHPIPIGCAKGRLTVVGSTAFRPTVEKLAQRYMADCTGSEITVNTGGSNEVEWDAVKAEKTSPPLLVLSDGPKPASVTGVREDRVAVVAFTLVVNNSVTITDLTTEQIRRIYRADVTNWKELGGPDLPIRLVSRDANSGTRDLLRQRILGGHGEPPFTSRDCVNKNSPQDEIVRCELSGTDQVLRNVARVEGAIGYSELRTATTFKGGLHTLNIDGQPPSVQAIGADTYRFTDIEYAYVNSSADADSLTSSFLNYMIRGHGQDELESFGHLPCYTPEGITRCQS